MLLRSLSLFTALITLSVSSMAWAEPMSNSLANSIDNSNYLLAQNQPVTNRGARNSEIKQTQFIEQLNLTEVQQQEITAVKQKYEAQITQRRENLTSAYQELHSLMAGTASNDTIRSKQQQVSQLRREIADLRFESMLEMRDVLTPAQRSELGKLIEENRRQRRPYAGNRGRFNQ